MKSHVNRPRLSFWQDRLFWLLLALGPACWIGMLLAGIPARQGAAPWASMLWVALLYPILEEFVFRGGIQPALRRIARFSSSVAGISLANVATSAVFAAMHLINQPPLWAASVFFPSLIFGWARDRYGHIQACTVLHIIYNAGFVWFFSG